MSRIPLSAIYCLISSIVLCHAAWESKLSFEAGEGFYNKDEDVKLMCVVTSDSPLFFGFELEMLKKQDGEWITVGQNKLTSAPFSDEPDKYKVDFENVEELITHFQLEIMGLDVEDTGDYMCKAGYPKNDDMQDSNVVKIVIHPDTESAQLTLKPQSEDGSPIMFNLAQAVECTGQADTLSSNIKLMISLGNGDEITQEFVPSQDIVWSGSVEAMKTPTTRLSLTKDQWMPENAGSVAVSCKLIDGDRDLMVQTFSAKRDETASVSCESNYKKPVRQDDLDVVITCKVNDYAGSLESVQLEWGFRYGKKNVTLVEPNTAHLRSAKRDGDKFLLEIPRVPADMVASGKAFEYTAILKHSDGSDIASTVFPLPVDSTRKIHSSASHNHIAAGLILISSTMLTIL